MTFLTKSDLKGFSMIFVPITSTDAIKQPVQIPFEHHVHKHFLLLRAGKWVSERDSNGNC
jgi:hypothetical protein